MSVPWTRASGDSSEGAERGREGEREGGREGERDTLFMSEPSTSGPLALTGANSTASRHVSFALSGKLLPAFFSILLVSAATSIKVLLRLY
jgi:hypothetical protein